MTEASRSPFPRLALAVGLLHLVAALAFFTQQFLQASGPVPVIGVAPLGGDFVNLWTVGRALIAGQGQAIYDPAAFDAFQQTLVGSFVGHRVWAYPPHSFLLAWPFGLPGYTVSLIIWSILGLLVLAWGARSLGLSRVWTVVLVTSPAALACVYWGQTGNLGAGLLMLALSSRGSVRPLPVLGTVLLTIKPQMGFLLPVYWALRGHWKLLLATALAVIAAGLASLAVQGPAPWLDYLGKTLPELGGLERDGTGPFMFMIPSVFMALRVLGLDGGLALGVHMVAAVAVLVAGCVFFRRLDAEPARVALLMVVTALITPYLHIYDLAPVLAGAALLCQAPGRAGAWVERGFVLAWLLPYLTLVGGALGLPVGPLVLFGLMVLAVRTRS